MSQILEDIPGTLEAIGSMIAQPIDTVKYIGNVVIESFNRDVIHGDAESRSHWFTYAAGSIFGFKGLGNAGKAGAQAAKQGVQKAGQKLDELLPYHPKHQLAVDGPVPYNVYDGNFFKDQLMVKVDTISSKGKPLDGARIINKKYAGKVYKLSGDLNKKYPEGVKFTGEGFPDFSPYSKANLEIEALIGDHYYDFKKANGALGLKNTPAGYTWHHVEDGKTMMLVPSDIHGEVRHTGGASLIKKGIRP